MKKIALIFITCTYCFFLFSQSPKSDKIEMNEYYLISEDMPLFGNCNLDSLNKSERKKCSDEALIKFIYSEFNYPKEVGCSFSGRVIMRWRIEKDGCISNLEFLRPSHEALEEEARRVVQLMPRWVPAKLNGSPISITYIFPLKIKLE